MYEILTADNRELRDARVKATYATKEAAIQAFHTELRLARAEHYLPGVPRYALFEQLDDRVAIDFGSDTDFIGVTNVTVEDLYKAA